MELKQRPDGSYTGTGDPGEHSTGHPRVSITDDEGRMLAQMAAGLTVLEIGTGLGVSTGYLASKAKRVVTLDVDGWVHEHVWPTLPANVSTSYDRGEIHGSTFDLVFIDGDHTPGQVLADIEFAKSVCASDGVIVAHDAIPLARLFEGWNMIVTTHGLAVWRAGG